jgi:hypothetical protein
VNAEATDEMAKNATWVISRAMRAIREAVVAMATIAS